MTLAHAEALATIYHGDCVAVMAELPEASVDAIVTDPPYGLEFMGKDWDSFRVDDPGTSRWRGERASASPGEITGADDRDRHGKVGHGGQRPRTSRCRTCGKRDMMRNPHACGDRASWAEEVTDPYSAPPAMLAFGEWSRQWALEAYRVLKPGGHILVFGGSRTYHRMTCGLEDAGFEVRDCLMWLYGSGFPKSLDVSKAIDKAAGAERPVVGSRTAHDIKGGNLMEASQGKGRGTCEYNYTGPATEEAARWAGWGTALKPAHEPIILARKPLAEKNVAANVLKHGTGALNVDGCRIGSGEGGTRDGEATAEARYTDRGGTNFAMKPGRRGGAESGRWPANVLLSHDDGCELVGTKRVKTATGSSGGDADGRGIYGTGFPRGDQRPTTKGDADGKETVEDWRCVPDCPVRLLDEQSGELTSGVLKPQHHTPDWGYTGGHRAKPTLVDTYGDTGGASRFFYTAKADKDDRDGSQHPTVKPVDLMKWLVTLITPPAGVVLDPFLGSGTTVFAARALGIRSIGIEKDPAYVQDAIRRLRQGQLL